MSGARFFISLAIFAVALSPVPVLATTFGLTPSVFEEQMSAQDRLVRFVEVVRANPDTDAYLLVSVRDDPAQAILLTGGERLLLPLGQDSVKYTFEIDAGRIGESGLLEAGIEFLSEDTQGGSDGAQVKLAGVVKVHVDVLPEGAIESQNADSTVVPSFDNETLVGRVVVFARSPGAPFFLLSVVAMSVCFALWASGRRGFQEGAVFVLCALAFVVALLGWALQSGRAGVHPWITTAQMEVSPEDGQFFMLASDASDDVFLNSTSGTLQKMEGDWRYIATANDRIFVVPATVEQRELYEDRLFRFNETIIQPYGSGDLPGLVTGVRENAQGIYAVFTGSREEDDTSFWCLANVWDKEAISCTMLDLLVREPITFVSFSPTQKNIAVIYTANGSYEYDVWREKIQTLNFLPVDAIEPLSESPQPLIEEGVLTRFGFVWLDGERFFTPGKRTYFPLAPSIWLESVQTTSGLTIFIVDTHTFKRGYLTDLAQDERLYWLQNGSFITSP